MNLESFANAPVALLPVLLFLAALVYLDSFKLVSPRWVEAAMAVGAVAAVAAYFVNERLLSACSSSCPSPLPCGRSGQARRPSGST